nr:hypothetical protein [Phytoactinopolyspora halotolerans]
MPIHEPDIQANGDRVLGAEFTAMSERVLRVTELTSRLKVLPFDDEAGKTQVSDWPKA